MVSISKSQEWSEPDKDLNLHLSDTETDGDVDASLNENDEAVENDKLLEEDKLLESSDEVEDEEESKQVVDDKEEFLHADKIDEMSLGNENHDHNYDSRHADEETVENDLDLPDDSSSKDESKDNDDKDDLLLIVTEKPADEDATEYENSVVQLAEQDSEDATLKDESLNCTEGSKSPSLNGNEHEECEDRNAINSPDDLMDIGDNVLDIGESANERDTRINHASNEEEGEEATEVIEEDKTPDDSIKLMEVDETTLAENGHKEEDTAIVTDDNEEETGGVINGEEEIETKEASDEITELSDKTEEKSDATENNVETNVGVMPRGRGKPKHFNSTLNNQKAPLKIVKSDDEKSPQGLSNKDSNKENVQEEVKLMENEADLDGVSKRSLRKRVSTDSCDGETTKKFKSATDQSSEVNKVENNYTSDNTSISNIKITYDEKPIDLDSEEVTDLKPEGDLTLSRLLNTDATDARADYKWSKLSPDSKSSFRKLMSDKGLKSLSRESLEAFIVQKICESLVYKSEMSRLNKCLKDREGTIDSLQREVVSLSKQSKDMVIVHEKLVQDLQRYKNNPEEPLLIPRITRSVGLQACSKDTVTKRPAQRDVANSAGPPPLVMGTKPTVAPHLKQILTVAQVAQKCTPVARATVPKTPKSSPAKTPVNILSKSDKKVVQSSPVKNTTPANARGGTGAAGGAGVIDLTSDDDKKTATTTPTLQRIPNGSKLVQQPNGHKIVMVNGHPVMVKIPTSQQANLILNNGAVKVISTTPTPIRGVQPSILRTTNSVNTITTPTTARTNVVTSTPVTNRSNNKLNGRLMKPRHPAPFPVTPQKNISSAKPIPPRPQLTLSKTECGKGIILSWRINSELSLFSDIASYQIYAYQETEAQPRSENWSKVGDVKALQLPMAVTLTQFVPNNRYYFSVRAVDVLTRVGPFSEYQTV